MGAMPIELVTGPANAGKAQLVMESVRRELALGRDPLLVVPTAADAEHYLRELSADTAAIGVRVERFAGLVGEAVRRAGIAAQVLDGVARERVIEALAAEAGTGPLAPGYIRALGDLFAELQIRRVTPARFLQALAAWIAADGDDPQRAALGGIYSTYRRALERLGALDGEQRAIRALDALRERPSLWGGTPVLFYGFDDLTTLQLDAIETLGRVVDADVTVSLAYEAGRTAFAGRAGTFEELAPLAAAVHRLPARAEHYAPPSRAALSHLERSLFEPSAPAAEPGAAIRLLEGGGERAELELVAEHVAALLREGMAAEEIAVMARPPIVGSELLCEVFASAGVPIARRDSRPLGESAIGAALIGLLRCAQPQDTAEAASLGDLLAWLRAPGLLERPLIADGFEVLARRRGIADAAAARALWEERHWPLEAIDRLRDAAERGPLALIDRAARELSWLFSAPRRGLASLLASEEIYEARSLAAGGRALAQLRELARRAPALAPGSPAELARCLERIELDSPERPSPGAVAVVDPLALRARRVRALFVCGLQEGVFPSRARPHPLLGEEERARLAETSGMRLDRELDTLAAERYLLYAAVSRPEQLLTLSWHVADDDGEPVSRSLFVDDVCDLFGPALMEERARRPLGAVDGVARGFAGRLAPSIAPLRDERLLAELGERVWSASSLERWQRCPVLWLVEKMLVPRELEPESEPLAQGGLAHAALEQVFEGLRARTGSARARAATLPLALELLQRALEEGEALRPLSVSRERGLAVRRRLEADLERYLRRAAEAPEGLEPAELELGFGFSAEDEHGDGATLPALELVGGVRVRGRIDRIDATPSGETVVIDYKSSRATPVAKWRSEGNLQLALYMLAVERLLGRRVVGGLYQPLSGGLRPRGLVEEGAPAELEPVRTDVLSHEEAREALAWAERTAGEIVSRAVAGELEPRPQTCAFRGGCTYPAICRCDR
jgi:ATP-dependent helicase/DNAse subunit B